MNECGTRVAWSDGEQLIPGDGQGWWGRAGQGVGVGLRGGREAVPERRASPSFFQTLSRCRWERLLPDVPAVASLLSASTLSPSRFVKDSISVA